MYHQHGYILHASTPHSSSSAPAPTVAHTTQTSNRPGTAHLLLCCSSDVMVDYNFTVQLSFCTATATIFAPSTGRTTSRRSNEFSPTPPRQATRGRGSCLPFCTAKISGGPRFCQGAVCPKRQHHPQPRHPDCCWWPAPTDTAHRAAACSQARAAQHTARRSSMARPFRDGSLHTFGVAGTLYAADRLRRRSAAAAVSPPPVCCYCCSFVFAVHAQYVLHAFFLGDFAGPGNTQIRRPVLLEAHPVCPTCLLLLLLLLLPTLPPLQQCRAARMGWQGGCPGAVQLFPGTTPGR